MSETIQARQRREALASIVGRTIRKAEEHFHGGDWGEHESYILELDDGRKVEFSGWGHDAWGCDIDCPPRGEAA